MFNLRRAVGYALAAAFFCLPEVLPAQRITARIDNIGEPVAMAVNTTANRIYVVDAFNRQLDVVDGATNQVIGTAAIGRGAFSVVFNPANNRLYVPNGTDNTVTVIDANTLTTTTVNVGIGPAAVAVNTATSRVYVANGDDNTVSVIDGASNNVIATLAVDEGPLAVAVNSVTNKIYVGNQRFIGPSSITIIDGNTNHTTTVDLPFAAYFYSGNDALLVDTGTNQIYAVGYDYDLFGMDGGTNTVYTIPWARGGCPERMALNPVTHHIYAPDPCSAIVNDFDGVNEYMTALYDNNASGVYVSVDSVRNRVYEGGQYGYATTVLDRQLGTVTTILVGYGALATNSVTNTSYIFDQGGDVSVLTGASSMQFVAAPPCRVLDTRNSGGPIQGETTLKVSVLASNCNIPATAAAYSLNFTLVPANGNPVGYLTAYPTDQFQPTVSTMNSLDGRVKANAAIVPAGTLGAISAYVSDTTNLVVDIDGYFEPAASQTLAFYPITPCRVIDTRGARGDLGGPFLAGGHTRNFPITESSCIPSNVNAQAYAFNFTAVPHGGPMSYLTVWPQGQSMPLVSTLNNYTATTVANAAIVPAGTQGGISVYPSNNTDLVVDIDGYFAPPQSGGLSLYAVSPCREIDTRDGGGPFEGELTIRTGDGSCGVPTSAQAYVLNATVVPPGPLGYLTLWPDGQQQPEVSTLNAVDGWITSNMAIVPSGDNGNIDAYASGLTNLILDVSSYFAP